MFTFIVKVQARCNSFYIFCDASINQLNVVVRILVPTQSKSFVSRILTKSNILYLRKGYQFYLDPLQSFSTLEFCHFTLSQRIMGIPT